MRVDVEEFEKIHHRGLCLFVLLHTGFSHVTLSPFYFSYPISQICLKGLFDQHSRRHLLSLDPRAEKGTSFSKGKERGKARKSNGGEIPVPEQTNQQHMMCVQSRQKLRVIIQIWKTHDIIHKFPNIYEGSESRRTPGNFQLLSKQDLSDTLPSEKLPSQHDSRKKVSSFLDLPPPMHKCVVRILYAGTMSHTQSCSYRL